MEGREHSDDWQVDSLTSKSVWPHDGWLELLEKFLALNQDLSFRTFQFITLVPSFVVTQGTSKLLHLFLKGQRAWP